MRQLTIVSGAGINLGISAACPEASEMLGFTYTKISKSVYASVAPEIQKMFSPESFDYILGGLMTVSLSIEKMKENLRRFDMNEEAFADLFKQSTLQNSIVDALDKIERQLTISVGQMLGVVQNFSPAIDRLLEEYDSINYFTVNFDGVFDHIIYGQQYKRRESVTDFWTSYGKINTSANQKVKIFHLHGDLRYKPTKKTKNNNPPYRWPVVVVGDQEVKKGTIASHEALLFYNNCLKKIFEARDGISENNLAIIGFGFREEDEHVVNKVKHGIEKKLFNNISLYDPEDKLIHLTSGHKWVNPKDQSLIDFIGSL